MVKQKKPPQPSKRCIFCGNSPLTAEHIFPIWIRREFPGTAKHRNIRTEETYAFDAPTGPEGPRRSIEKFQRRPGLHLTRNVRCVCKRCNGEWMKDIQDALREILLPLTKGHGHFLNPAEQKLLSTWIAMKTMVAESAQPPPSAISQTQLDWFKLNKEPPEGWSIAIGTLDGIPGMSGLLTFRAYAVDRNSGEALAAHDAPVNTRNTQSTLMLCGSFLAYVVSSPARLDLKFSQRLRRIWPITDNVVLMPTSPPLSYGEAMRLAQTLVRIPRATYK